MEFRNISEALDELLKPDVTCVDLITRSSLQALREVLAGNGLKVAIRQDFSWNEAGTFKYTIKKIPPSVQKPQEPIPA